MVSGAAVPVVSEAPGLSTDTLFTVTKGWKGEFPPMKTLSSRPMRVVKRPTPARTTVFGSIWYATPRRGCHVVEVSMELDDRLGSNRPLHDAPSPWLVVA